jgi:hypothetical protein
VDAGHRDGEECGQDDLAAHDFPQLAFPRSFSFWKARSTLNGARATNARIAAAHSLAYEVCLLRCGTQDAAGG